MGQKVNPVGIRLGITRTWDSRWFAKRSDYAKFLHEDVKIRYKACQQTALTGSAFDSTG